MTQKWTAVWGNAPSIANTKVVGYAKNVTLRYNILSLFSGSGLRIQFTNFCGNEPITISKAFVAKTVDEDKIDINSIKQLSFSGKEYLTLDKGKRAYCDKICMPINRSESITISFYLADYTEMRTCVHIEGPLTKAWFSLGDYSSAQSLKREDTRKIQNYYFLNTVDVLTDENCGTTILYGDSWTAGDWPDYVTLGLLNRGIKNRAVIRRATSGSRILGQYDCADYAHYGIKAEARFDSEMTTSGADSVVILHGINDIIHPDGINPYRPMSNMPTAQDIINGYRYYISIAKKHNLKVYFATLLPIYNWRTYAPFREQVRCEVNNWITGNNEADGFIDFNKTLADEHNPLATKKEFDCGDHLHPNAAGYKAMAELFLDSMAFENGI